MLRRITIREILLTTALAAVLALVIRDRWLPNPLDAYAGFRIDQYLISDAAHDVDPSSFLMNGQLTGGFAGGRMLHQGFAVLECDSAKRDAVVANIKERIRVQLENAEWQFVENLNTPDDLQISAINNGTISQLIFQFVSPKATNSQRQETCQLSVQWAELGFSQKWRLEL